MAKKALSWLLGGLPKELTVQSLHLVVTRPIAAVAGGPM